MDPFYERAVNALVKRDERIGLTKINKTGFLNLKQFYFETW
jgi:hypothetical protein